jgi:hypothetical protein
MPFRVQGALRSGYVYAYARLSVLAVLASVERVLHCFTNKRFSGILNGLLGEELAGHRIAGLFPGRLFGKYPVEGHFFVMPSSSALSRGSPHIAIINVDAG